MEKGMLSSELGEINKLRLLDTYLLLTNVKVKLVRDLPSIKTSTLDLRAKSRGEVITVPLWLAEVLIDKGIAVITDEIVKKISRNVWREYAQPKLMSLAQVDKDFYPIAKIYLHFLRRGGGKGLRPLAKEEDVIKVMNKRLSIIMNLATIDVDTRVEDRLTYEEKVLLNHFRSVYREWKNIMGI